MPPGEGGNLADRLELYLSEGNWSSKTKNEKIGVLNWFVELVGSDMDVRLIDSSHVIKFKNAISSIRLHAKTNSSLKQAQTTIKEQQIDSKTAKKKFDTAKTFLHWFAEIGAIHNVPAPHVKMKVVAKPKSEQRRPFTADELAKLFSSPLYSGCKSGKRRYLPGKIMLRDNFF
ncbi:MAG: hypothetical protein L3J04_00355 [Robiginitomaculum sp.]|nr:hypothetical protein [Robiginitomaculum sp.]